MRADMGKVLVEAPRHGRTAARALQGARRQQRNRLDADGESAPQRQGMKRDGFACKSFGEHLGPLYRYLRRQANRPWDKVYSELSAGLDKRSVVQAHLFQHIADKVATSTVWRNDAVWVRYRWDWVPLSESRAELYVHPRTGLLLVNRAGQVERSKRKQAQATLALNAASRRLGQQHLAPDTQWHRVDGVWYEVKLRPLDRADSMLPVYDVLLRRQVDHGNHQLLQEHYGAASWYAWSKRQLDSRTMRRHGLAADTLESAP